MSKDSIDNVRLERLDTEDQHHMEKRVLRKVPKQSSDKITGISILTLAGGHPSIAHSRGSLYDCARRSYEYLGGTHLRPRR
jgi:hypothetical protein